MPKEIISKKTRCNLELLEKANVLNDFYLVGGTGLALQLKHRLSIDLDFFTEKNINTKVLIGKLKELGALVVDREAENTLDGAFNGTKIMFLKYPYPLLFPLQKFGDITVANAKDIGCMKVSAISSRGTKKDFIDLFFVCKNILDFKELLKLFKKKYKGIDYNMVHILKSLTYFDDAEKEPMPKMLKPDDWTKVKLFFQNKVNLEAN